MTTPDDIREYRTHVETATDIIDNLAETIIEQRDPVQKGMPYRVWKQLAIRLIADHLHHVEKKHRQTWRNAKLVMLAVAVGTATISFWGGLIVASALGYRLL